MDDGQPIRLIEGLKNDRLLFLPVFLEDKTLSPGQKRDPLLFRWGVVPGLIAEKLCAHAFWIDYTLLCLQERISPTVFILHDAFILFLRHAILISLAPTAEHLSHQRARENLFFQKNDQTTERVRLLCSSASKREAP
jgi:hypothetical protein